jgi:hypothetical protein
MFKRYTAVLLATLISLGIAVDAQGPQEKFDQAAIEKIKEEGMKRSQVMDILSFLTDVPGSRLTGSPGLKAAQDWAKQKLASWGLQNAALEAWGPFGRGWSLEGFSAALIKPNYTPLIAYPKAWSPSTNGVLRAQPIYLEAKTEADLDKYKGKLKGAIVLLSAPREVKAQFEPLSKRQSDEELLRLAAADPPSPGGGGGRNFARTDEQRAAQALQTKKWLMLQSEGAALALEPGRGDGGTLFVQSATLAYPEGIPRNQQKSVRDKDAPPIVPQIVLAVEHYNRLIRMIQRSAPVELEFNITSKYHDQDLMSHNVIAEIPGSDLKDEIVMLGAHFDSWHSGTGATDNAAGSAVCMEALRILQTLGLKPRRTIRIGLWSGEEQGLLGSRAYVTQHFAKRLGPDPRAGGGPPGGDSSEPQTPPQFEIKPGHEKFAGYFNLDNGTGKIRGIYLQGNEEVRPIFRAWFAPFKDLVGTSKGNSLATISISNTGGTDHQAFDGVGLPGFQFIQDPIEYDTRTHHSNMDVYDRIQEEDMKQAATIMAAFVYNTAMRDKKLPRKPLPGQPVVQTGR